MLRIALAVALAALLVIAAPSAARGQLTATSPVDGASAVQGQQVSFAGAGAGSGFSTVKILISSSPAVNANGMLAADPTLAPSTFATGDAWTVNWTLRTVGRVYWQAHRTDCTTLPCAEITTPPRLLIVTAHPALIRPAPTLARPKAMAQTTLGGTVGLEATDRHASKVTFEAATNPTQSPDGAFTERVFTKTVHASQTAAFKPTAAGVYYWHAIRQGCTFTSDLVPETYQLLDVDCASRRVSETRSFSVVLPAARLALGASGYAYRSGGIGFDLKCANPPCRVKVKGTFVGKGTGGLPVLRRTIRLANAKLTFQTLRPSKRQQRRIAAAVNRRGRLRVLLRAESTDTFGQHAKDKRRITLRKPKPPKPPSRKDRVRRDAERAVGYRVAERYEIGEDRVSASCRSVRGLLEWKCTWETDAIDEPWGERCWYSGEADASLYASTGTSGSTTSMTPATTRERIARGRACQ